MGEVATTRGRVRAISVSKQKGLPKTNVREADLQTDYGIVGDAHAGGGHRQISLLAGESIDVLRARGVRIAPGDFAENITTEGLDMGALKVGGRVRVGAHVELELTQLGKTCHGRCKIFERLGDCIMPREGVFARVVCPGRIQVGDEIEVIDD